jgi:hypothetical protein
MDVSLVGGGVLRAIHVLVQVPIEVQLFCMLDLLLAYTQLPITACRTLVSLTDQVLVSTMDSRCTALCSVELLPREWMRMRGGYKYLAAE